MTNDNGVIVFFEIAFFHNAAVIINTFMFSVKGNYTQLIQLPLPLEIYKKNIYKIEYRQQRTFLVHNMLESHMRSECFRQHN